MRKTKEREPKEIQLYRREREAKKAALEKKLKRKLTDAEYCAYLINGGSV